MAPNYGEESRDPKRNVPRALYISVIGLGIFYILTSWAPFAGYSSTNAAAHQAQNDPANYYLNPANNIAGHWVGSILSYLIITGSFACGMAFHNTTARYGYSLGREGLLPRALGRTHPRYKSPFVASIAQSVIAALIVIGFAVFTGSNDPTSQAYLQLYGLMAVMGVIVILSVQALVSLSIFIYFERHPGRRVHWWKTRLAPAIAFLVPGLCGVPAVRQHQVPRQRLQLRELARAHRPAGRAAAASSTRSTSSPVTARSTSPPGGSSTKDCSSRHCRWLPASRQAWPREAGHGRASTMHRGTADMGYLIGADIGSQSVKALLVDPDGREVASAGQGCTMSHPASGWAEQDPAQWRDGLAAAVRQVIGDRGHRRRRGHPSRPGLPGGRRRAGRPAR